jgi:TonB-dependent starch-binding outer membrane protein SusC
MRKVLCLLIAFIAMLSSAWAQRTISGKITDDKGSPVPNVSIQVKGTNTGTVSDADGSYSLTVPANAKTLVFSSVGMATQEVNIGNQNTVSITMATVTSTSMDEIIVVGYGTQRRRDVTAAISQIGADKIRNIPVQSFEQALQGKAAGLNIIVPNGVLNNPPVMRIRGVNSINGSSQPLIIVDGVPLLTGDASTNLSANNALGNINPNDIEDVQILKDAAAAAIYGSRAANGVMLITTKKGRQGKARVNYDAWAGYTEAYRVFEVLGARDYVAIKNEAIRNANFQMATASLVPGLGLTAPPAGSPLFFLDTINGKIVDTRWADEVFQRGFQHSHNVSVSGANASTRYFFSANYTNQNGSIQTNNFQRRQIRMNLEQKVTEWLKIGGNFNFSRSGTRSPNTGSLPGTPFATSGAARLAFVTAPNVSPYLANGTYNFVGNPTVVYAGQNNQTLRNSFNQIGRNRNLFNSGFTNPVMVRDLNIITNETDNLIGDVNAEIKILKGLTFRTQYGVNWLIADDRTFYNSLHGDGIQTTALNDDGTAFNVLGKYNVRNFQNVFNYNTTFAQKHNLGVTVGSEENKVTTDRWGAKRSGLGDIFYNEYQGSFTLNDNPVSNAVTENYLLSFFGRVNYNFQNKYFLSLNGRRDGYSAFAEGKKWGNFWGVSGGWNISDEAFYKGSFSQVVNRMKLRGSYGTVGNLSAVANFASLSVFGPGAIYGNANPSLVFAQAGNKNLTWETSKKIDAGLEFGLWNNRLEFEIGYYRTNLSNLIIDVPTPPSMGIPGNSISANAASMYNQGFEFSINAKVIEKKDFNWSVTFNLTTQRNRVTSLAPGVPEIVGTTQLERTNITRPGFPIGSFFLVKTAGVDPTTGQRIFVDKDGREVLFNFAATNRYTYRDGSTARAIDLATDGYIAGNALPTYYGGLVNNFYFKGFDLNFDVTYSGGNSVYFGSRAGMLDQRFWNNNLEVLNRWQKPGDQTNIPRVIFNDNISNGSAFPLDFNLFNGGFVRVRNISLGYTLSNSLVQKMKLSSLRVYVQGQNLFLFTNYPGSDPEISVNGASALTPGVDRNTVGQARTITFGLNLGF